MVPTQISPSRDTFGKADENSPILIHVASWDGRGRVGTRGVPGRFFACQDIWCLRMVFTVLRHIVSRDGFWCFRTHGVPGWFFAFWDTSCPGMVFGVLRCIVRCPGMVFGVLRYIVRCPGIVFGVLRYILSRDGFSRTEIHSGSLDWFLAFWDTSYPGMVFGVLGYRTRLSE